MFETKTSEFNAVISGKPSNRLEFTQAQMREARKAGETTVTYVYLSGISVVLILILKAQNQIRESRQRAAHIHC